MDRAETHKWLVKYSRALHKARKSLKTESELELFDNFVRTFLETAPDWWGNGSDTELQATTSPELFLDAITTEVYPGLSYQTIEEMQRSRNL